MTVKKIVFQSVCVLASFYVGFSCFSLGAYAQTDVVGAATAQPSPEGKSSMEETHPALRVTPDKSELVRLDADAKSVVVGNPDHVSVLVESSRLLVVVPKTVGSTYFTVLGEDGKVVMQRHVIVGSPKDQYVRVKKTCQSTSAANKTGTCKPTSVYYCPDMCHNIGAEEELTQTQDQSSSGDEKEKGKDEEEKQNAVYEEPAEGDTE